MNIDLSTDYNIFSSPTQLLYSKPQVGHETIESSDDATLRSDMPPALRRVETASSQLQQASDMLRADPYSGPAR